ncbi:hypothetical protein [Chamaesiphon minutus]|uniref:Uncharacterized protein n=1 Tax=Chamaesiphon minutus (strain ATCC 27169 / PCC 6605) TaxID=1173020 RepID=K9ULS5_CHAP6|nr:hypothetical protein [Chamaesiphon minutus]AFY95376.1 hypothetical protein Cha6605_4444 [Chamaesiphon minutus PCC 6605]
MLIFPEGVRLATSTEIPFDPDLPELLAKISNAQIEPGYIVHEINDRLFKYYIEANVNAKQVWPLFCSLCKILFPEESQPVLGDISGETLHGEYANTAKMLELFDRFQFYLANDCSLQFGLGNSSPEEICEVFVASTKHFQIWTNTVDSVEKIMADYDLRRVENLQFIDEFPRVTTSLEYKDGFDGYQDLLEYLTKLVS